ncbi:hypothetical protein B566_EDAN001565 [Ephemera danica]|nr:hypothetical protein B566_EDAN001565 [Ephemera danica]
MQQRSSTVLYFVVLAAFFVKVSNLTIERFDHKREENTKTIDTRELPTECKAQVETLQRQTTEQNREREYLELLERLKNNIRSMNLKLKDMEKKLLSCSNLHDEQDKDQQDKDPQDNFAQCSEAIQNLTDKHINLVKLLEESTAEWLNWTAAREFCRSRGMDLVAIESEDENKAIASHGLSFGAPFTATNAWTSGCYSSERGSWFWHSTDHTLTYQNWWKNHGNLTRDGNCIVLDSSDTTFLVKNMSELRPFICEL